MTLTYIMMRVIGLSKIKKSLHFFMKKNNILSTKKEKKKPTANSRNTSRTNNEIKVFTVQSEEAGITKFTQIKIPNNTLIIRLKGNNIRNFADLPRLPQLRSLFLDKNPIDSFAGVRYQPVLKHLSLKFTPLTKNPYFNMLCVIAFGSQLVTINNESVNQHLVNHAEKMKDLIRPKLRKGYLISNLEPLKFYTPVRSTKRRNSNLELPARVSVAVLCDYVIAFEDDLSFIPNPLIKKVSSKLAEIRQKHPCTDYYDSFSSSCSSFQETNVNSSRSFQYIRAIRHQNAKRRYNRYNNYDDSQSSSMSSTSSNDIRILCPSKDRNTKISSQSDESNDPFQVSDDNTSIKSFSDD